MQKKYDAVIIGAGIMGSCIGFELSRKGYKTLNVDRLPAAGYGSTSGSCAIIRLNYSTPEGVAMAREGYYYWIGWPKYLGTMDERGLANYVNTGALIIKTERNKGLVNVMANLDKLGVVYVELDTDGIKALLPIADTRSYAPVKLLDDPDFGKPTGGEVDGAVYIPESGYITDPQLSTHNVQRAAEAHGARFLFNSEVVEVRRGEERATGITLSDGTRVDASVVVNAAGPHSYLVNRMADVEKGMKIKTRAIRVEVCHVPAPEGFDFETMGMMLSDGDIGNYARPEVGNHVLTGSEEPDCDELEQVDPDNYNKGFSNQWTVQVMRQAQRLKGLPVPNQPKGMVDLYDLSDDWIPIYDKSDLPGFYMAVGTSGNQYKNAPVIGAMMTDLIEKCEAGHDHDLDPVQFQMKYTGWRCNVGFYSRLREIVHGSSFSVIG